MREVHDLSDDAWGGSVFLWPERGLYLGAASDTCTHAPHAIKICVAIHGSISLRTAESLAWYSCRSAVIAPDQPHQFDGRGAMVGLFYLIPETEEARRILQTTSGKVSALPTSMLKNLVPRLRKALDDGCSGEQAREVFDGLVQGLSQTGDCSSQMDARVECALDYLRSVPDYRASVMEIAEAVSLSPSRISHLFAEQAGLPIRRYLLWLRLRAAIEEMATGDSLTEVAYATGFSDSAHLSRTFRQMMGLMPSQLFRNSQFIKEAA